MGRRISGTGRLGALAVALAAAGASSAQFSEQERAAVQEYWLKQGSIRQEVAGAVGEQWVARLTPEGSVYLREFYRTFTNAKVVPTADPTAPTAEGQAWQGWLDARIAFDDWAARRAAAERNAADAGRPAPGLDPGPPDPGPAPGDMALRLGEPPRFAGVVRPVRHTVRFHDGTEFRYLDHVAVRPKYAYYRFHEGVMAAGTPVVRLAREDLETLFDEAGVDRDARVVMAAVSLLEGGFDSVNTYDTGFVSVGFIQFASLSQGGGSLGRMMLVMKEDAPQTFDSEFRRFGVDVGQDGLLVVVDPSTGEELAGPSANMAIIQDKRLTAVFQRAGAACRAFRVAQVKSAYRSFYPADDRVTVVFDGVETSVRVGDVFRSQAGMATLTDRKVNTGNLRPLAERMQAVVDQAGLRTVAELAQYEQELVRAMTYRKDYLLVASLRQPRTVDAASADRRGTRTGRGSQKPPEKRRR